MKMLFHVFGIPIHFFGVMIAVGILAALWVARKEIKRKNLELDKLYDLATYTLLAVVIGARIFYIVFYRLSYYMENPIDIIKVYEGGLSVHGGIVGGLIVAIVYVRRHQLDFWSYADAIVPGVILAQGIGRVGCDVFGKIMSSGYPWGIEIQGELVHPVQLYEALLNYIVFYVLWQKRKRVAYKGQLFVWYLLFFSINRGVVEIFRYNPTVIGWLSISHVLSVLFIIVALILRRRLKSKKGEDTAMEIGTKDHPILVVAILLALTVVSIVLFYGVHL